MSFPQDINILLNFHCLTPEQDGIKLDYIKLALFYGDRHVLEMFDRLSNSYCVSAISKITKRADAREDLVLKMFDTMRGQLNSLASRVVFQGDVKKYTSINHTGNLLNFFIQLIKGQRA